MGVRERIALDAPVVLTAEHLGRQFVDHVGGVGAGDLPFDLTLVAVVDQRLRGRDAGRRMGDLVGQHLVFVGAALERGEPADRLADHPIGEIDGVGGGGEVGGHEDHDVSDYRGVTERAISAGSCEHVTRGKHRGVLWIQFRLRPEFGEAGRVGDGNRSTGHRLVYGGGHVGLMGTVADARLARVEGSPA